MGTAVKVGLWSVLLGVPSWTAFLLFRRNTETGAAHIVGAAAAFLLVCAVVVGLFGVGFALFERDLSLRQRIAGALLCFPALGTGATVLLVLSQIPPT